MIEIWLSSDGKHTVHANVESLDEKEVAKAYKIASAFYEKILVDHGAGTKQAKAKEIVEKQKDAECETCGTDMRYIPAGFSKKTNRPYDAFYACDGCGARVRA